MSDFGDPTNLLCLSCGNLVPRTEVADRCPRCGSDIDLDELLRLYDYAANVYYYGHQYRITYEAQQQPERKARYYIEFAGEAFAWTMLAVLSGVVGNAAYDLIKVIVANVREAVVAGKLPARDYSALLALSDIELGDLVSSAKTYANDMDGLTKEVRLAIIEEIAVDAMMHEPKLLQQMTKFMEGGKLTAKEKRKFVELLRTVVVQQQRRIQPKKGRLNNLWTCSERQDEG